MKRRGRVSVTIYPDVSEFQRQMREIGRPATNHIKRKKAQRMRAFGITLLTIGVLLGLAAIWVTTLWWQLLATGLVGILAGAAILGNRDEDKPEPKTLREFHFEGNIDPDAADKAIEEKRRRRI